VTAPNVRRNQPGFSQLAVWIPTSVKNRLIQAARLEGRAQRDILEDALGAYFAQREREKVALPEQAPAKPAEH